MHTYWKKKRCEREGCMEHYNRKSGKAPYRLEETFIFPW